jgi:hypothetical protein
MQAHEAAVQMKLQLTILLLAMAVAVAAFAGVALFVGPVAQGDKQELEVLRWVAALFPLIELPLAAQVWMLTGRRMQDSGDWRQRLGLMRSRTIVVAAIFEAPALLAGVVLLLLGPSWHILPAFVVGLAGFAALLPTRRRVRQALEGGDARLSEYS